MLQIHHEKLRLCQKIWDVTSSIFVDRVRTRSAASHAVTRKLVSLSFSQSSLVASKWRGLRFENANGGDLEFFPAFCLIRERNGTDYALIDIRNIDVRFNSERFIENEQVPNDAQVVGQAWEKSNKDGSPDRRFGNNRQFPVLGYGVVEFRSNQGLNEAYMFSNQETAREFVLIFQYLQNSIRNSPSEARDTNCPNEPIALTSPPLVQCFQIPELPKISGAHEYTLVLIALAGLAFWSIVEAQKYGIISLKGQKSGGSQLQLTQPTANALPTPFTMPTLPTAANQSLFIERVITLQNAKVRTAPSASAAVIKTLVIGTTLRVYGRSSDWVQVGDEKPFGWINERLLRRAP